MLRRAFSIAIVTGLLALVVAAPAGAVPAVSGEFDVPGLGSNNKIVQGPDGNMWVTTGGGGKDVAKITPAGQVEEFAIEAVTPSGITVGPEGRLWVARNGGLVSFLPGDPTGTKEVFNISEIGNQPSVVLGPDRNLWVVGEGKEKAVRVPPGNPAGAVPFPVAGLQTPKDIDAAGQLIVIAAFEHIYALNAAGTVVGDQKIGGQAQGVGGNPNGQYAFTQPVTPPKEIGLLSPIAAPIVRSAEGTDPFGVTLGSDGAYWSPEFVSDGLSRITADGTVSGIKGFAKNSGPRQIAAGPGNTLWVTLEMTKKVGRVSGLEPPVGPPAPPPARLVTKPRTNIGKGPKGLIKTIRKRAQVSFTFSSPDAGASFTCRVQKLVKKGAKKAASSKVPAFRPCKSPQKLRLGPGRYRFEVEAVLAGVADESPARRTFRVVRVPKQAPQ